MQPHRSPFLGAGAPKNKRDQTLCWSRPLSSRATTQIRRWTGRRIFSRGLPGPRTAQPQSQRAWDAASQVTPLFWGQGPEKHTRPNSAGPDPCRVEPLRGTTLGRAGEFFSRAFRAAGPRKTTRPNSLLVQTPVESSHYAGTTLGRAENFFSWPSGAPAPEGGDLTGLGDAREAMPAKRCPRSDAREAMPAKRCPPKRCPRSDAREAMPDALPRGPAPERRAERSFSRGLQNLPDATRIQRCYLP